MYKILGICVNWTKTIFYNHTYLFSHDIKNILIRILNMLKCEYASCKKVKI